ncbi:hypothetical protein K439DRAFT_1409943 [Ramaria rubella]|nr:hypothetical protein K439DRAFT_1409943 [Ramaria rubella]
MSSPPERQELLRNAISFLSDPKTQSSPLAKRIEFLESKGLTPSEIEDALRQSSANSNVLASQSSAQQPIAQYAPSYAPAPFTVLAQPPAVPQLDWRDYFIMAVVSGGVMFGVISLARKYLLPHLKPPSSTAYESDKDALTAQFDAAEALLKDIQTETSAVRITAVEQKTKIEQATTEVEAAVKEMREGEGRTRDEMREIRQEIDTIQEMLPKMLEKNKEAQAQSLAELQQELKSLKTLLLSRGPSLSGAATPPPFSTLSGRPSIPSWQLAGADTFASGSTSPAKPPLASGSDSKTPEVPDFEPTSNGVNNEQLMFSQFRSAVEHLAQQQSAPANRRPASSSVSSQPSIKHAESNRSTNSLDEARTPSQLAESALSNFRKNLVLSRSSSPAPSQMGDKDIARSRRLEDRLRASFAVGDASERTTPDISNASTPGEVEPASVELPLSPASDQEVHLPSVEEAFDPLGVQLSPTPLSPSASRSVLSPPPIVTSPLQPSGEAVSQAISEVQDLTGNIVLSKVASPSLIPLPDSPGKETPPAVASQEMTLSTAAIIAPIPHPHISELSVSRFDSRPSTPRSLSPFVTEEKELDVEKLRERLKLVERRFSDVSTSFKRLQAEKRAVDTVIKELTPLQSITDIDGLRDHFKSLEMKTEISADEIKRLNGRLQQQDLRFEELRDMHRLETASQSEQVERLRKQVSEAEALLKAGEEASNLTKAETEQLRTDIEKFKGIAKEEEEKRTKAISLLKTVRAKLVKAEKEKEDAVKEAVGIREKDKEGKEKEQLEKSRLELDLERARLEKDREVTSLRNQFEREMSGLKDKFERDSTARKGQFELEAITTKAAHTKELAAKTSRVTSLEAAMRTLSQEKDDIFDQLQLRQAELESSQSHLESVEAQTTELQYQLREAHDRVEILMEELTEAKGIIANGQSLGSSTEELARILAETEGKYEARISDLRSKMRASEKERQEAEDEWSKNLQERSRELERLRGLIDGKDREYAESIRGKAEMEERIATLEGDKRKLKAQTETEKGILLGLQRDIDWLRGAEVSMKQERDGAHERFETLAKQLEETKIRENVLKTSNKTLREELRKVQSSAALLERQRNPGLGYWSKSPRTNGFTQSAVDLQNSGQPSRNSLDEASVTDSTRPGSPVPLPSVKNEEEVNLEYLRNVILQFLEHKEMRPNLVRVLSIILHFTPQETRRLIAKV